MMSNEIEKIRYQFFELIKRDRMQAVQALNHEDTKFPTLFAVRHEIGKAGILQKLNDRNQWALKFISERSDGKAKPFPSFEKEAFDSLLEIKSTLNWILKTGGFYAFNSSYLRLVDQAAIYSLHVFHEHSLLPFVVDMIFYRCRNELYYNHLCWALFEAEDPDCLLFIGKRLLSDNEKEKNLALTLLSVVPGIRRKVNPKEQYQLFIEWFYENRKFLVYSGETFDTSSHPIPFVPSSEAMDAKKMGDLL